MTIEIKITELSIDHPAVKAAYEMVAAHIRYKTMNPAVFEIKEEFPELDEQVIMAMWIAINAKTNIDNS